MTRLIKKYKNRRLYDMQTSQYLTVDSLYRYLLQGIKFRVEDSVNKKDITRTIMLQIMVEIETSTDQLLSADLLEQMIIFAQNPLVPQFKKMLEQFALRLDASTSQNNATKFRQFSQNWQDWVNQWDNDHELLSE